MFSTNGPRFRVSYFITSRTLDVCVCVCAIDMVVCAHTSKTIENLSSFRLKLFRIAIYLQLPFLLRLVLRLFECEPVNLPSIYLVLFYRYLAIFVLRL